MNRKIGIDARFIGPQGTGLGKYTQKLIENLAKIDKRNQYSIFLRKSNWDYLTLPKNFKKVIADVPWYSLAEQLKMPAIYKKEDLDLLHVPHFNVPIFYSGKFVVTIHDLIHHQFSEYAATTRSPLVFKFKRFAYRKIIKSAIYKSQHIIVPSKFVKDEIVHTFEVDPSKITATYEAAEEEYQKMENGKWKMENASKQYGIKAPFVIYVGNAYPHKNLDRLLKAFKQITGSLVHSNWKLVIVCSRDVFAKRLEEKVKSLDLTDQVTLTGYIPAEDLSAIFKLADAYVFPSLSEGFGIPGLNAMASGIPVIASDIPTLKEIYGNAALYFDPKNPNDIADKISKVIADTKTRSQLVDAGSKQVKKYSWRKMAEETLEVYKKAI